MSKDNQLKIGAILSYVAIFINIAAGMLYTPWMVRQIGQSDYGLYTLANSLIALFLVDFGLSSATSRYISKYRAEGNAEAVNNFLGAIYKLYLLITMIIFAVLFVLFFFIDGIYDNLTASEIEKFKVVYLIAGAFSVFNFPLVTFNGILTSYERFIELKLAEIVYRISFVGSTLVALLLGKGLYALVALHAAAGLLCSLYKFLVIKSKVPIKINFKYSDSGMYKEIFSFSIWVTLASLAQRLIFNITPSILGIVANTAAIAVFGIVSTFESYVYTITSAIKGMFLPKISKLVVEDESKLNPLLLGVGKYLYALNGLIVAGFIVLGKHFIDLWMGKGYELAYMGILLVTAPGLFHNAVQIAETTMIVKKKVNIQAYVAIGTGVLNVILSLPLSKFYGVIGSCISIFIAYMAREIALNIIYHKALSYDMITFCKKCYIRMSLPIVATILFGIPLNLLLKDDGWMMFVIKGVIIVLAYLVFVYLLGFGKDEKRSILNTFKAKIKR